MHAYTSCSVFTWLLILSGCHNQIKFVLGGYDYNLYGKWPTKLHVILNSVDIIKISFDVTVTVATTSIVNMK